MKKPKPKKSPALYRRDEILPPTTTNRQLEVTAESLNGVETLFDQHPPPEGPQGESRDYYPKGA